MFEQAKREAYRKLTAPLPIQSRQKLPTHSLISFVQEQPKESILPPPEVEDLSSISDRISLKKVVHQIGQSLPTLFQTPIYKSHDQLNTTDNEHFCSWQTDENYKFNVQRAVEERSYGNLEFQSRFQSGNLGIVAQTDFNPREYYLALQRDVNSASTTTQWFYFKVSCKDYPGTYTFHIVNYVKPFSMFKVGMKPCVLSTGKSARWERGGYNIQYRKNSIPLREGESYYTFSFSYDFPQGESSIYFAYCYPYTYTKLLKFLDNIQSKHHDKMRRKIIARTNGGNAVQMISITNPLVLNKKLLYVTARVHPGQTVSSFVCESIIEFFLSNHPQAEKIREQFIIKIVPMLNPDGVINGSYRCSLSGSDLNREWKNPCKNTHPQIYHLKKAIVEGEYKKLLFLDIHGHSKKRASFMYGCVGAKSPYAPKELPYLLSKRMSHFSYHTCNFAVSRAKEGTSRISLWRSGIEYSYTYEISFCGPQKERRHFNIKDLHQLGIQLSKNLSSYFYSRILQLQIDQQLNKHCQDFYNDQELFNMGNQQTNGSSSELQDELPHQQFGKKPIKRIRRSNRTHNSTQKTETGRLNDLLEQYMLKKGKKQPQLEQRERQKSKQREKEKEKEKEEKNIYLRQRQSFMVTRVNLTQIPQTQSIYTCLSTYYGFAAQKGSGGLDQGRSMSLKNSSDGGLNSQRKCKPGQSFGILLPNVQKGQYRRYQRSQRYKKEKIPDRSVSEYVQNIFQQNQSMQMRSNLRRFDRQMSVGDRIKFRISQKSGNKF